MSVKTPVFFDALNLDDITLDAMEMFDLSQVLLEMSLYSAYKARAMFCRDMGSTDKAIEWEGQMENIYKNLPKWAQW